MARVAECDISAGWLLITSVSVKSRRSLGRCHSEFAHDRSMNETAVGGETLSSSGS
jgi:hypothetical protein